MKKRRHHYVPCALTRQFTYNGKLLFQYDLLNSIIAHTSPKNVFVEDKFYHIPHQKSLAHSNSVEDMFSEIESRWCQAIHNIAKGHTLSDHDRMSIALFIAAQYVRTPAIRKASELLTKMEVKSTLRIAERFNFKEIQELRKSIPEILAKHNDSVSSLLNNLFDIEVLQPAKLLPIVAIESVAERLIRMNWCFLHSEGTNYFALGDNPCSVYDPEAFRFNYDIGLDRRDSEIVLPTGRNCAILASPRGLPQRRKIGDRDVEEVNRRTAFYAERFIVFPIESKSTLSHLQSHRRTGVRSIVEAVPTASGETIAFRPNVVSAGADRRIYNGFRPLAASS